MARHDYVNSRPYLGLFLATLGLILLLVVLIFISGGFFLWVILAIGGIAGLASFHYLLWGKLYSDQVAGEREEAQLLERIQEEETPFTNGHAPRRY
jgi:protein-S-isoprenylcysteine O-methyltransferase Ste14